MAADLTGAVDLATGFAGAVFFAGVFVLAVLVAADFFCIILQKLIVQICLELSRFSGCLEKISNNAASFKGMTGLHDSSHVTRETCRAPRAHQSVNWWN
jgi:hypothetical protein